MGRERIPSPGLEEEEEEETNKVRDLRITSPGLEEEISSVSEFSPGPPERLIGIWDARQVTNNGRSPDRWERGDREDARPRGTEETIKRKKRKKGV